jgi:large subunit ribosomal protein L24e
MPKCTFCGIDIKKGTGKMFVYTSGKTANFCSNKCEKNLLKLKRKPMKTRWTKEWIKENKKVSEGKKAPVKEESKPVVEEKPQVEEKATEEPVKEEVKAEEKPVEEAVPETKEAEK